MPLKCLSLAALETNILYPPQKMGCLRQSNPTDFFEFTLAEMAVGLLPSQNCFFYGFNSVMPWECVHPASRRFRNSSFSFRKCMVRGSWLGNYFGRSHQKAALKYWVRCRSLWVGREVYALKWIIFFKGGKTGESYWTGA